MIAIGKTDRITTAERYALATDTADLTPRADRRCDADKLIAAGWAAQGDPRRALALDLYRMGVTGNTQGLAAVVESASGWLSAWSSRKGRTPLPRHQRQQLVAQTLHWWLKPTCGYCEGRMFELLPSASGDEGGVRALSTEPCQACHGSGKRPLAREVPSHHVAAATYLADELDRLVILVTGEMAKRLAPTLSLEL